MRFCIFFGENNRIVDELRVFFSFSHCARHLLELELLETEICLGREKEERRRVVLGTKEQRREKQIEGNGLQRKSRKSTDTAILH